jgi:hypothetical protein
MESRVIHLLLIDGEPAAEDLADRLRGPGFVVEWCRTVAQGRTAALSGKHDVVVCLTTPPFIALIGVLLRWMKGSRFVFWTMDLYPDVPLAAGVLKSMAGGAIVELAPGIAT